MKLTRRRRRKIYKGVGIALLIILIIWLILINPFKYIHFNFNFSKKEDTVLKDDSKEKEKNQKKIEEEAKRKAEEEAKRKAEEEKKKKEELEKKKQQEQQQAAQDKYYSVTFFNPDGTVLKILTFKYGTIPSFGGEDPSFYDGVHYYEFIGWDKVFSPVVGNAIYVAQYKSIGDVDPTPTPDPKPKPKPDPEEPEIEVIDLKSYDIFYIENVGTKKGKVQIINGVGDYSKIENKTVKEMLAPLKAPELHLQYSFDKENWHDFDSYGSFDVCAEIMIKQGVPLDSILPENKLVDSKEPIVLNAGEKVYFKAKTGYDNLGFSNGVFLQDTEMPCINFFDIRGYEESNDTTFAVGGDLKYVVDDDYIANETNKTNKQKVSACNPYGFAGLFGNISNEFISIATGVKEEEAEKMFMTNLSLSIGPVLKDSSLERKKVEINLHNGDNIVSATDLKFPSLNTTSYVCYSYMFADSNRLEEAPNIGVVKPGTYSFIGMFASCDNLSSYQYPLASSIRTTQDDQYTNAGCYQELFAECSKLTKVIPNLLPATVLSKDCYFSMFRNSAIAVLPSLPAKELATSCYDHMYYGCQNIPESLDLHSYLLSQALGTFCYRQMFANSSITNLPALPATPLKDGCYDSMFAGCEKLREVPINYLQATELAPWCYQSMFEGSSITSVPNLHASTIYSGSYSRMFANCKNIVKGPIISLANFDNSIDLKTDTLPLCDMFNGCDNLREVVLDGIYIDEANAVYFRQFLNGIESKVDESKRILDVNTYTITEPESIYIDEEKINNYLVNAGALNADYWELRGLK